MVFSTRSLQICRSGGDVQTIEEGTEPSIQTLKSYVRSDFRTWYRLCFTLKLHNYGERKQITTEVHKQATERARLQTKCQS